MHHGITEPARLGQTTLPDGRALAWAEWGPAQGTPVLVCPGAATSRSLGLGGDVVEQLGIRLVSVDRPGLGASDPAPGRTLADWVQDVRDLAAARELARIAIVGISQGAPFALACAAAGLATGVAVVSGTDELASPAFAELLVPDVQRMVDAVATDPAAAEAFFRGFSADAMWNMIIATSGDVDRRVYDEPAFERAYRRALAEGFAQGPDGYARDTVLAMSRWPFDPARITVPVDLWYGARDTSPVHSPDFGASLARRIPGARRHVLPKAGGSLPWTHAGAIFGALLSRTADRNPAPHP